MNGVIFVCGEKLFPRDHEAAAHFDRRDHAAVNELVDRGDVAAQKRRYLGGAEICFGREFFHWSKNRPSL